MNNLIILGIGALVLVVLGFVIYFKRKSTIKKVLEKGKLLGASEARDEVRTEVIEEASAQIEKNATTIAESGVRIDKNREVIDRSNEAILKARAVREKAKNIRSNTSN